MNKPETSKEMEARLKLMVQNAADQLGEHFVAIRIIATWDDCGSTKMVARGSGNQYAMMGMTQAVADMDRADNEQSVLGIMSADEEAADPGEDPPQQASA